MVQELAELPGTKNMDDLRNRAQALSQWKVSMQRGFLPGPDTLDWPVEPFQSSFVNALNNLGMPRFTRRYPKLLDSLLRQMMQLVHVSSKTSSKLTTIVTLHGCHCEGLLLCNLCQPIAPRLTWGPVGNMKAVSRGPGNGTGTVSST